MQWKVREKVLPLGKTLVMGVLNLTPDSFSDGGQFFDPKAALLRAKQMIQDGADILDLGAESTRPGAQPVSDTEELDRLLPVLRELRQMTDVTLSIDTTKAEVARVCLEEGAHIINDVSGLQTSGKAMAQIVHRLGAGLVLMHRRGNPQTMNDLSTYEDLIGEIRRELEISIHLAESCGISKDQIVLDPGLGFAKKPEDNFNILNQLERFEDLGFPILIGPSRKSFIGQITGRSVEAREFGTAAAVAISVFKGARVIRVHEVGAMKDAARVAEAIKGEYYVRA